MAGTSAVGSGLRAELTPPWPFRLPARGGPDSVSRVRAGIFERFLHVDGRPILIRAWERPRERGVRIAAIPIEAAWLQAGSAAVAARMPRATARARGGRAEPTRVRPHGSGPAAGPEQLERAIERARNALGVDDDYGEFYARFKRDPLLGPAIRRMPWLRGRRCMWPWESLAWALTEQLIEVQRAHLIQRRIIARWGAAALPPDRERPLRDVPSAAVIGALAPAELVALDLAPKRALALVKVAKQVASGRIELDRPEADRRLLAVSEIGPWTVQMLGRKGRGDPDALPAGDLAYLKLVPRLLGMDRRATVGEVEEFFAPYAPFRGWAGLFALAGGKREGAAGKPLRYHPPRAELEAA